jgi:hypothetical protein
MHETQDVTFPYVTTQHMHWTVTHSILARVAMQKLWPDAAGGGLHSIAQITGALYCLVSSRV